ncbi:MAG: dihydroneopterin aldolase [Verrucomicrobia bacterium]|nr:dihydroneopterin aldolase [Verrucomicrobiota bacterium]
MPDTIEIRRLEVRTRIGVPDDERAEPQRLWISVEMTPSQGFDGLADDIARTVDYHAVALQITSLAAAKPRRLIETLATEIAGHLLGHHPLGRVRVTIEKRILPDTDCVAVSLERHR